MPSSAGKDTSLQKRVIVAVIFIPLLLYLFWNRGIPFIIFLLALTAVGQYELYRMIEHRLRYPHHVIGYMAGQLIVLDAFLFESTHLMGTLGALFIGSFAIEIVMGRNRRLENLMLSLFAAIYPALFISFIPRIAHFQNFPGGDEYHQLILPYTLLIIWMFDTASYFGGRFFGRHPFFPEVSPKKTIEGFVGGLVGVLALGIVVGLTVEPVYLGHAVLMSLVAGLAGQIGDLSESVIKRDVGMKDSSNIIPGHGGVLDRFDSLFFAAPAIYAYLVLLERGTL